jgi:hypothetical protein
MEYLEVKSGPFIVIRRAIGILNLIAAILMFIVYFDGRNIILLIASLFIASGGIYYTGNGFGLERSWIRKDENYLIIKWIDKLSPVRIHNTSIEKISLERKRIVIYHKLRKPVKLNLNNLEKDQKTEVYNFLIEYSKQKNILLERHSSTLIT